MTVSLMGVSKWYYDQNLILDKISLTVQRGAFLYIVGESGAGKSTLLRLLATEEAPSSGIVSLFDYDLNRVSPNTLRAIRQSIGYIPQNIRLIPDMSVYDNIALSLSLAGKRRLRKEAKTKIEELLEKLGLVSKQDKPCRVLSGGEAQRVAFARAMIRSPELIIADEPTGAQDRKFTWSLMELLHKANLSQSTVLIATHDPEIVRRLPKRCAVLKKSRLALLEDNLCIY